MKNIIAALVLSITLASPAHALNARTILGAPFWAVGFVVRLIADVTIVPFKNGSNYYYYAPAVKGW